MTIIPKRNEISFDHCWDLSVLYADLSSWEHDFEMVTKSYPKVELYKGKLHESTETIVAAIKCFLYNKKTIEKLYTYAHLKSDEDTSNSEAIGLLQRTIGLYTQFSAAASYITPELLSIDTVLINRYLQSIELKPLRRFLTDILRYKPHTLSEVEESLLAQGSETFGAFSQIFSQLNNADLLFESIEVDGSMQPLTHSSFTLLLKHKNRSVRQNAFQQYYKVFDAHKHVLSANLAASIKRDVFLSRARKHPSSLSQALFADNIDKSVFNILVDTVANSLTPLHNLYKLRKKILKLDSLCIYDTYTPIVEPIEKSIPYNAACSILLEAVTPLGEEYCSILAKGLKELRWVDRYENQGKRSGAYAAGCYDSPPYMMLNYKKESLEDLFTLAHEAGHAMHSYFSRRDQTYQDHDYTIFVAEVASTVNEQLLLTHLEKQHVSDPKMLAYLLNHQLDSIKATFYRQTMFAEFEKETHEWAEANKPLTLNAFTTSYEGLLRKYFGPAVSLTETDCLECFRIPHFYSPFYVYKYATGISAAITLTEELLNSNSEAQQHARNRYLSFLKSGCSKYSLELLIDAGVDLHTKNPIEKTASLFESKLKKLSSVVQ